MAQEWIDYTSNGQKFRGYLVYNENVKERRPVVIIAHAWRGQDDFARNKAAFFAELGYAGFAADLYGDGKSVENNDEAAVLMAPLFIDRKTLRSRIVAAYQTASKLKQVDPERIGALGFCFGGLTVL